PVKQVWIVQRQEPIPAATRMLREDRVNAFGRAPVAFPQFRAGLEAAPEHGVVVLKHPALVINDELVALFEDIHRPTERIHESYVARRFEEKLTRRWHAIGADPVDFQLRGSSWRRSR